MVGPCSELLPATLRAQQAVRSSFVAALNRAALPYSDRQTPSHRRPQALASPSISSRVAPRRANAAKILVKVRRCGRRQPVSQYETAPSVQPISLESENCFPKSLVRSVLSRSPKTGPTVRPESTAAVVPLG